MNKGNRSIVKAATLKRQLEIRDVVSIQTHEMHGRKSSTHKFVLFHIKGEKSDINIFIATLEKICLLPERIQVYNHGYFEIRFMY